ncbi:MAG TPA: dUTP diphosphatase [Blastocatellia bacterium]
MLELKIKLLEDDLPVPRYQHEGDAGLDLPSRIDYRLEPGERAQIPTGIAVAIPRGYAGFVIVRSGLAARHGIACVNAPGLIDAGYRGEINVILLNTDRREPFVIRRGERIAQLVLQKVIAATVVTVDELDETARGEGGFGSTGRA